jgi:hypothetical protein
MFQFIRKHQAIGLIFIGIVIVSFVIFFSPNASDGGGGMEDGAFGSIGGEPIRRSDYIAAAREARLSFMLRSGNWPGQSGQDWNEQQEVFNRLFLMSEAKRLGISVTDAVAASRIVELPFLQDEKTSAFSRPGYDQFLALIQRDNGMMRGDFEQFMRHEIALQHLVQLGGMSGALVPPREAEARYRQSNEQFAGQVVLFAASNYLAQVNLNPTNLTQFYSNRLAEYRTQERVIVRYVRFAATNFMAEADEKLAANTNLTAILDSEYTRRGAEAFRDPQGQPMTAEAAKAQLKEEFRKSLALDAGRRKANEFANKLYQMDAKPESLNALAQENNLAVQTSVPFDQFRPPADMRVPQTFNRQAFALSAEEPFATPLVGDDGVYVFAFEGRIPSEIQPFEAVQARVTDTLRRTESRALAEKAGRDFVSSSALAIAQGKTFEAAAVAAGFKSVTVTNISSKAPSVAELGPRITMDQLLRVAREVPVGSVAPFTPAFDGGFVLFVQSRSDAPAEAMATELPEYLTQTRQFGRFSAFSEWEKKRFASADVKIPGGGATSTNAPAGSAN